MSNFKFVLEVAIALGIVEIIKISIVYIFKKSVIAKNLEVRNIADNILNWSAWLKRRDFKQELPNSIADKMYIYVFKLEMFNGKLAGDLMDLLNRSHILKQLKTIQKNGNLVAREKDILENFNKLHDLTLKINRKCNKLRYKPLFRTQDVTKYFKMKIRKILHKISAFFSSFS